MDSAGNNRYELLFMDDDVSDPLDNIVAKNKKQVKTAAPGGVPKSTNKQQNANSVAATKAPQSNKKPNQAEKENKPSAMNKNELNKKAAASAAIDKSNKQGGVAVAGANANRKRNGPGSATDTREGAGNGAGAGQGHGGARNINFKQQNGGETREQRNNRRNTRENGFNNTGFTGATGEGVTSQQQPRQMRDRDSRGPPRTRNLEGVNRGGGGKREFDRQSGSDRTGVKSIDKRDGAGAHNWGSVKETIDDVNKNEAEGGSSGAGVASGEKTDDSGNEQADQATAIEEETKELTLDEWKAQKQQRIKPTFNIRKAGEGEDTSQWKKMIVLNNSKKKENESEEELEYDPALYPQRVGRQQRVLDIQFNFNDGRRGGGGFGNGRGRGRGPRPSAGNIGGGSAANTSGSGTNAERPAGRFEGGRTFEGGRSFEAGRSFEGGRGGGATIGSGRGGKRIFAGDRQYNAAPKVNDERQFPTLS